MAAGFLQSTVLLIEQVQKKARVPREDEERVVAAIKACPSLNELLEAINLAKVLDLCEDHWTGSAGKHRTELVAFLASRSSELSLANRLRVLHAVHRTKPPGGTACVAAMLCATRGAELSRLKRLVGTSLDALDLAELCLDYLKEGSAERKAVLEHVTQEGLALRRAAVAAAAERGSADAAGSAGSVLRVKVLSDIDDTCMSSLFDNSFPSGIPYPGLLSFYHAVDIGPIEDTLDCGEIVFLTARPGFLGAMTHKKLAKYGFRRPTLLTGSVSTIFSNSSMAKKKYENYQAFRQLWPECRFVFCGDSGQGDIELGRYMLAEPDAKEHVAGIFIHDVISKDGKPKLDAAARAALKAAGIFVFDSYLMAAAEAFRMGLISAASLRRVATDTKQELGEVKWQSPAQKAARWAEYEEAFVVAHALLPLPERGEEAETAEAAVLATDTAGEEVSGTASAAESSSASPSAAETDSVASSEDWEPVVVTWRHASQASADVELMAL